MTSTIVINDRWLQDEFVHPWTDRFTGSKWVDGVVVMSGVLPDGRRVFATALPGTMAGLCNHPVPERAMVAAPLWAGHVCRMIAGHDCPHVAVTQHHQQWYITSFSIQRDRGPVESREPRKYDYPVIMNLGSV